MQRLKSLAKIAPILFSALLMAPELMARTCAGNGEIVGSYGYFASRDGFFLLGATAPGSNTTSAGPLIPIAVQPTGTNAAGLIPVAVQPPGTTAAVVPSNTPWGRFFASLANNNAFSSNGRIFADGAGNLFSSDVFGGLTTNILVGNYTVSTECSIVMTLRDPFTALTGGTGTGGTGTGGTGTGVGTTTGPTVRLEGMLVDGRIEAVVTGPAGAGAIVTFVKTSQFNGCTVGSVSGNFGVLGTGMVISGGSATTTVGAGPGIGFPVTSTGTPGTGAFIYGATSPLGTPFTLLGRFTADGLGNLQIGNTLTPSPLRRTLTGSYTVNVDCTGTMRLSDPTGITRNINFVLVNEETSPVGVGPVQSLRFVFTDPGVIGSGTATLQ